METPAVNVTEDAVVDLEFSQWARDDKVNEITEVLQTEGAASFVDSVKTSELLLETFVPFICSHLQIILVSLFNLHASRVSNEPHFKGCVRKVALHGNTHMQVAGHRGFSDRAPENTLASIRMAIDNGAQGVEFDVQMSSEGQIFLLHDSTLRRTASPVCPVSLQLSQEEYDASLDKDVSTLSFQDFIQHVDVGVWKDPEFRNQHPCLLEDAMKLLPPGSFALCEIKGGDMATARKLTSLIHANGWGSDKLCLIGFDFHLMAEVKRLLVGLEHGSMNVIFLACPKNEESAKQVVARAKRAGLDGVDFQADPTIVTREVVSYAKEAGLLTGVWIWKAKNPRWDSVPNVNTFMSFGIDFFTTDMPPSVTTWLNSR